MAKSVFEKYEADKAAKKKKIADLEIKVSELEKDKAEATAAMDAARAAEDVAAYTKHKAKMNAAIDGLEVFGANLKALKAASLYGNDQQKVINEMRDELTKYEEELAAAVLPILKKVLEISGPAADEYSRKSKAIEALNKDADANKNGSGPIAWKIGNINRTINNLIGQLKSE